MNYSQNMIVIGSSNDPNDDHDARAGTVPVQRAELRQTRDKAQPRPWEASLRETKSPKGRRLVGFLSGGNCENGLQPGLR
jgi:hypothetical protein